ncbi:hypothetical protein [Agilicoccus flavus]|uniref:hypothetical protein n=1 Tax=Agilicoccus flavus TaxID=2775968 RepID=UPI001CF67B17|nr:hypothetical protein [Agilicoccus flavus]
MHTLYLLHAGMLAVSAGALLATVAGTGRVLERSARTPHLRLLALLVSGALVVGNVVSLLPGAPQWYSIGLMTLTAAGLVWLAVAALSARSGAAVRPAAPAAVRRPHAVSAPAARPAAPVAPVASGPLYATVATNEVIDAEVVEDTPAARTATVHSIVRDRPRGTVTAADLRALGPNRGAATHGETYVAAALGDYVPADRLPRNRRGQFPARRHGAAATQDAAAQRLRVLRAYGATGDLRGRLRSTQA